VLLLEAMSSFGGYLNPFQRRGYTFDTGLHYLAMLAEGETFYRILDELGIRSAVDFVELDPDGFDRLVFPDFEFALCKGKERLKERLINTFRREERGINRFFDVLDKIVEAATVARSMGDGPLEMLRFLLQHPVMIKYTRVPYQVLLDEVTSDVRLQAVLAGQSGTYAMPPARASVLIALLVLDYYLTGARYPRGGGGALRDAFLDALRVHDVDMRNRSRVSRIDRQGDAFLVETLSGEQYSARAVISDVDPSITLGQLTDPQLVPLKIRRKAGRLRPSMGACCAFLGTDLDLPALGVTRANIHHHEDWDVNKVYEELNAVTRQEQVPYGFITSSSIKDPQGVHAPPGHHTIEIVTPAGYGGFEQWANLPATKRGEAYNALKERIGRQQVAMAERYIPGLAQHLDYAEYATPLSSEYWVGAVRGGMYGPEHTPGQMGGGRFPSGTCGIEGLFLAGAGTIGGGVSACVASGLASGRRAAEYLERL
jgi:phytoene dehydrogenase-like protein